MTKSGCSEWKKVSVWLGASLFPMSGVIEPMLNTFQPGCPTNNQTQQWPKWPHHLFTPSPSLSLHGGPLPFVTSPFVSFSDKRPRSNSTNSNILHLLFHAPLCPSGIYLLLFLPSPGLGLFYLYINCTKEFTCKLYRKVRIVLQFPYALCPNNWFSFCLHFFLFSFPIVSLSVGMFFPLWAIWVS